MLTVARLACTLGAGIVTVFVPIITSGVTAEYKYNELAVQTPVIVYQINDVNDSTKNVYVFDTEMQKAYFNDGDIKEGNLTEAAKAAGFKYGRTVIYDDKDNPKYLNIKFKKNGDIKSVEVKEEYYKQNFRSASGLLRTECADANQKALRYTYFIAAIVLVVLAMPMFFYGFKNTKERFGAAEDDNPRRSDTTSGCCSKTNLCCSLFFRVSLAAREWFIHIRAACTSVNTPCKTKAHTAF